MKGPTAPASAQATDQDPERQQQLSQVGHQLLHAHGSRSKGARHPEHQRPHQAHVSAELRAGQNRHHQEKMQAEAREHIQLDEDSREFLPKELDLERKDQVAIQFDEEGKKRKRGHAQEEQNDAEDHEEEAASEAPARQGKLGGKLFKDEEIDRVGDPNLSDPSEMKRILGPSVRFAQHAMLLAEQRLKDGMLRQDALAYLSRFFTEVADREYARKALREFGPGTGIIDLYPLELAKHLLDHHPEFFARLPDRHFLSSTSRVEAVYKGETGKPIVFTYDPALRIRGFAIKGGDRPGYLFEPVEPPGTYHLTFKTPGTFAVLVSAHGKSGQTCLEEIKVEVVKGSDDLDAAATMNRVAGEGGSEPTAAAEPAPNPKKKDLTIRRPLKI